jgi:hypothetical protein
VPRRKLANSGDYGVQPRADSEEDYRGPQQKQRQRPPTQQQHHHDYDSTDYESISKAQCEALMRDLEERSNRLSEIDRQLCAKAGRPATKANAEELREQYAQELEASGYLSSRNRHSRAGDLPPEIEAAQDRAQREKREINTHTLVGLGRGFGCSCGMTYLSCGKSRSAAEMSHSRHKQAVAESISKRQPPDWA